MLTMIVTIVVPGFVAQASAASFTPASGTYTADTTALTLTGPGTNISGVDQGGIAVFSFDSVSIPFGVTIEVEGSRPFEMRSAGAFLLAGLIEGSGFDAETGVAGPVPGGPGGGAGGADGTQGGFGPGGGGHGAEEVDGGGGGGFGGTGATGGSESGTGGAGGSAYGNLQALLQGGSGGGGGSLGGTVGGGGGGGGVQLTATTLTVAATGEVWAAGGNGNGGGNGASGGGSGGGILLHADTIDANGILNADGGEGGTGGCCGDGGGGGGGRIAYEFKSLVNAGNASVAGGTSGTSGPYGFGELSPQVAGAPGVITKAQAATATTGAASSITANLAKLSGSVNPNGHAATYRFEYGTSTSYGTSTPVPNGAVGSDAAAHELVAQLVGLKPKTTYHYRIVAEDELGFVSLGADATFKTKAFAGVSIHGGSVPVKNGIARIRVSAVDACKGKLKLLAKTSGATASGKRGKSIKLGAKAFSIGAGKKKTLKVHLSHRALELLANHGSLRTQAKASVAEALGNRKTTAHRLTLKSPKKR
ncbi:MAG TPA: hypothetical protein VF245_10660 [Solirubrobacterales bacterium]